MHVESRQRLLRSEMPYSTGKAPLATFVINRIKFIADESCILIFVDNVVESLQRFISMLLVNALLNARFLKPEIGRAHV